MQAIVNPFRSNVYRKMYLNKLIQAIRLDIAGELDAIDVNDANVQTTDIDIAKKVIADSHDEGKATVSKLMTLLCELDLTEAELCLRQGVN